MIKQAGIAAMLTLAAAPAIAGKPTRADIAAARGECRYERQKVAALEASGKAAEADLKWERSAWDRACAYAERLMVEAGLEKPSAAPVLAQPVPQFVITEKKSPAEFASAPAATAPQPVMTTATPGPVAKAEIAAAPAVVSAPTLKLKEWPVDQLIINEQVKSEK